MNIFETWEKLKEFNFVKGEMPPIDEQWDLSHASFIGMNLSGMDLRLAYVRGANFVDANLSEANLGGLDLTNTIFHGANLNSTYLEHTCIHDADFYSTSLIKTNFRSSSLYNVDFSNSLLDEANLGNTDIHNVNFSNTHLINANFVQSLIMDTIFENANLIGCNLMFACINNSCFNNARVFGISSWDMKIDEFSSMKDIIISKENEPLVTVDDLEVAQFIYSIINNERISKLIDGLRTKSVLILGSFDKDTMPALESIKDTVRAYGFIPMLFNFKGPKAQELMETVRVMALLANFVIVDLSVRSGQLHELASIVPTTYVPFVTVAKKGTKISPMQNEFKNHFWYRSEYFEYASENIDRQIPQLFKKQILPWVHEINQVIRNNSM